MNTQHSYAKVKIEKFLIFPPTKPQEESKIAARNQAAWLSAGTLFCNLLFPLWDHRNYYYEVWTNHKLSLLLQITTTTTATFPARQFLFPSDIL